MPKTVFTTTISLPKSMAATLKQMSRTEGRTTSDLVREALRHYEQIHFMRNRTSADWTALNRSLKRISRAGKSDISLSEFVIRDRERH